MLVISRFSLYALTVLFCLAQRGSAQRDGPFSSSPGHSAYATKARTVGGVSVTHEATVSHCPLDPKACDYTSC